MKQVLINDVAPFRLYSFGNGWAYRFVNDAAGADIWFQDADALIFRDELDGMACASTARGYVDILRALWSHYDELARPIESE